MDRWHGDTFSIAPEAVRLAQSQACNNQAFQYSDHVIGLQFHLDYSLRSIRKMIRHCGEELVSNCCVQTSEEVLLSERRTAAAKEALYRLLDNVYRA